MGSFSEAVLSFNFKPETPAAVLAAFSALSADQLPAGAPALPAPAVEPWDMFEPDFWPESLVDDPFRDEPWRHDWASWISSAMGVTTTPHGTLTWAEVERWNLDCRFSWKSGPTAVAGALSWIAPYVDTYRSFPKLVGHVHYEYEPKPHLLWVTDGQWSVEDLNPEDHGW